MHFILEWKKKEKKKNETENTNQKPSNGRTIYTWMLYIWLCVHVSFDLPLISFAMN